MSMGVTLVPFSRSVTVFLHKMHDRPTLNKAKLGDGSFLYNLLGDGPCHCNY